MYTKNTKMKKWKDKIEIARWYSKQVMENSTIPYKEIEWLVTNLNEYAMNYVAYTYYENKKKNEEI